MTIQVEICKMQRYPALEFWVSRMQYLIACVCSYRTRSDVSRARGQQRHTYSRFIIYMDHAEVRKFGFARNVKLIENTYD